MVIWLVSGNYYVNNLDDFIYHIRCGNSKAIRSRTGSKIQNKYVNDPLVSVLTYFLDAECAVSDVYSPGGIHVHKE